MGLLTNIDTRKAKIVCTIGPSSSDKKVIASLIKNGMNVARMNFSHGDHETHRQRIELVRELSGIYKKPVAILQDLQGVKIRVGLIEGGAVELKNMLTLAGLITESAIQRKGSVGAHYRSDFPDQGEKWQKHMTCKLQEQGVQYGFID